MVIDADGVDLTYGDAGINYSAQTFEIGYPLHLLAVNTAGTSEKPMAAKLYSCQIYDGDTLVRDFISCINPDGEAGLYDCVNSVFYASAGSGAFTAGADVGSLTVRGVVTQITDASGNVLWSATKLVTISFPDGTSFEGTYSIIRCTVVDDVGTWNGNDLIVPVGTQLKFYWYAKRKGYTTYIYLNGSQDAGQNSHDDSDVSGYYYYTVTQDATVTFVGYDGLLKGYITEIPENHALVTISGYGSIYYSYLTIDGANYYNEGVLAVPIGTTITCNVYHDGGSGTNKSYIVDNDDYVFEGRESYTYEYTVKGNALFELGGSAYSYGYIYITDQ